MIQSLKSFINKNQLFQSEDILILAISGGVDSMVMLDLIKTLNKNIHVAHVNHGLRGDESDADEIFIEQYCKKEQIPFYSKNIGERLKSQTGNLQALAREQRYAFFNELKNKLSAHWILTAHHYDDSIETMIHHFFRGTGLDGLTGIKAKSQDIIRPLINFTKEQINEYANTQEIKYREDSSNTSLKYKRNYIRKKLLDPSDSLFPNQKTRLRETLSNLKRTKALYEYLVSEQIRDIAVQKDDQLILNSSRIIESPFSEQLLFEVLKPYGYNYHQCLDIITKVNSTGSKFYSENYCCTIERDQMIVGIIREPKKVLIECHDGQANIIIDDHRTITCYEQDEEPILSNGLVLDKETLTFPLTIRNWEEGDAFHPSGMKGKKQKISKALRNYKVPHHKTAEQMVLLCEGEICGLIPFRSAEGFAANSQTKKYWCIELIEH